MTERWHGDASEEVVEGAEVSQEIREEFERMKRSTGAFRAFAYGKENGIPQEELAVFIRSTVAEKRARGEHEAAARLLQTTGIGTPEEIFAAAEAPPMDTAESVEGDVEENEFEDLVLPADATFADLAAVFEGAGNEFREAFEAELVDILNGDAVDRIIGLLAKRESIERVRDVFTEYGLDEDAVADYFFIRFGK